MTFTGTSFEDDDYDKHYYHVHFDDKDADFTVEGDPYPHEGYRVLHGATPPSPYRADFLFDMTDDEFNEWVSAISRDEEPPEAYGAGYIAGVTISFIAFITILIFSISLVGLMVYGLVSLVQ